MDLHISPLIEKDKAPSSKKLIEFLTTELAASEALDNKDDSKIDSKGTKPLKRSTKLSPSSAQALLA